jgi:outer membrane receptor protein involved in Fe transport
LYRLAVALVLSCALSSLAHAQQLSPEPAHEVTVVGERDSGASASTQVGATQLSRDQIAENNPANLADAVRHAPGVSVQQTTPSQATIYVRGLSGRELAHYVDGIRLNSTIFRAGNNPFIGLVDALSLRRIDVLPGANSVLYGGDALGGAVLMSSGTPGLTVGPARTQLALHQSVANNPLSGASRVEATRATETFAARVGVSYAAAGPITPGEGTLSPVPESYLGLQRSGGAYLPTLSSEQRGTEHQYMAGDLVVRTRLGNRRFVTARGQHARVPRLTRYDQLTPRFKQEVPARAVAELSPMTRSAAAVRFEQSFDGATPARFGVQLAWQRLAETSRSRNLDESCVEAGTAEECLSPRLVQAASTTIEHNRSDALSLLGRFEVEKGGVGLTFGASLIRDIVSSKSERRLGSESSPTPSRFPDGSTATEAGVFARARLPIAGPLRVDAGSRLTVFDADIRARPAIADNPGTSSFELTAGDYAADLALVLDLTAQARIAARAGRAMRAPNVQDLSALGSRAGSRYQVPNTELEPEHGQSADLTFELDHRHHRAQSSVFYQRYSDAIVLAPTTVAGADTTPDGDRYYHSINASVVEVVGIETQLESRVASAFSVFGRGLAMRGVQHNPRDLGVPTTTPADRTPPAQGDVGLRWHAHTSLTVTASVAFRLRQDRLNDPVNIDDNRIPEGGTPGFTTLHLRTAWSPKPSWRVQLNLDNLTNELVLEHGSGFYRPGFAASLGVAATFGDE